MDEHVESSQKYLILSFHLLLIREPRTADLSQSLDFLILENADPISPSGMHRWVPLAPSITRQKIT